MIARLKAQGKLLPVLALLAATAMWGSTFAMQKDLFTRMDVFDFLGIRFGLAGLVCAALFFPRLRRASKETWRRGLILGVVYTAGQELQTLGLSLTTAATTGFLTGLYVVLTPVVALLLYKVRQPARIWAAVLIATLGLALLSLKGFSVGLGEVLVLASAVIYAFHVVLIERFVRGTDPITLTSIQMIGLAPLCLLISLPGGIGLPRGEHLVGDWLIMGYMVIFTAILTLLLQVWAQERMSATNAALVMTGEPVWAALFAVMLIGEVISPRSMLGGVLIVGAMVISQIDLPWLKSGDGEGRLD